MPVRRVAAFLRALLIFKLDRCSSNLLIAADGMMNVEQAAVAGIAVRDQRLAHGLGDGLYAIEHLRIGRQTGVGQSEVRRYGSIACHIERVGLGAIGELGGDQVEDPGQVTNDFSSINVLKALDAIVISSTDFGSCVAAIVTT